MNDELKNKLQSTLVYPNRLVLKNSDRIKEIPD